MVLSYRDLEAGGPPRRSLCKRFPPPPLEKLVHKTVQWNIIIIIIVVVIVIDDDTYY